MAPDHDHKADKVRPGSELRFDRRAREHRAGDVACCGDDIALGIGDDESAAVAVFDEIAARLFDEDGVGVHDCTLRKKKARKVP